MQAGDNSSDSARRARRAPGLRLRVDRRAGLVAVAMTLAVAPGAHAGGGFVAGPESRPVAQFRWLDKITAEIEDIDVLVGDQVAVGGLVLAPKVCYGFRPSEPVENWVFVQISEVLPDGSVSPEMLFSGYMSAESPGLNALQHPVYDVWLESCKWMDAYVDPDAAPPDETYGPVMIDGQPTPRPRPDPLAGTGADSGLEDPALPSLGIDQVL